MTYYVLGQYIIDKICLCQIIFFQAIYSLNFRFLFVGFIRFLCVTNTIPHRCYSYLRFIVRKLSNTSAFFIHLFPWNKTSVFHVPALISVISVIYVFVKHGTAFKDAQPNDVVLKQFFLIFRDGTRFNFRWLMIHAVSRYEKRNHDKFHDSNPSLCDEHSRYA